MSGTGASSGDRRNTITIRGRATDMVDSRCGLHCTRCQWKNNHGCGGCIETNGNPFHGECPVAICCQNEGYVHCGQCPDIPCELLTQYSYNAEHGDNGERIRQCLEWAKGAQNV